MFSKKELTEKDENLALCRYGKINFAGSIEQNNAIYWELQ
jgi:hypothetical protein